MDHIIFRKPENGYTIFVLIPEGIVDDEELASEYDITCTGIFASLTEGENLKMTGEYVTHPNYGRQFSVKTHEVVVPQGEAAILRYLSSGAVKGIGPALAKRIVKAFKADTFRVMEEEPERLAEIKGISMRMATEISDYVTEKKDLRDAMVFLSEFGLGTTLCLRIYNEYGPKTYDIVKENPYRLAEEIPGVGFKIADDIAAKEGILLNSEFRVQCGMLYVLGSAAVNGHTYLPEEEMIRQSASLLRVDEETVMENLRTLEADQKVIPVEEKIYSSVYYYLEKNTAALLRALDERYEVLPAEVDKTIAQIEKEEDLTFDEIQKEAIFAAASRGIFVLTGGPGTGKTTTIRGILSYFEKEGLEIALAAPTGRAAKRMTEATGRSAKTLHRLLEVKNTMEDDIRKPRRGMFDRNEDNPLEADAVIVDEMSMVDINLMYALVRAIPLGCRLILVGDVNQLPSVGPGNVLKDIIASDRFRTVKLEKIFRQDTTGDIVLSAHQIREGILPKLDNKSRDFFFMQRSDADSILSVVRDLVETKMPRYVNTTPFEVQVLSPMKKGYVGVENLNVRLQEYLNPKHPSKAEHLFGEEKLLRVGDKVMQIKNNYQLEWKVYGKNRFEIDSGTGVFNGDLGIIREINEFASFLVVEFDEGRMVEYPFRLQEELELAYATTIHKSQGSEYPAVVIPLLQGPEMLMHRNLIYTAITRAQKCVVLVGDPKVFVSMIQNTNQMIRYSGLREMLTM